MASALLLVDLDNVRQGGVLDTSAASPSTGPDPVVVVLALNTDTARNLTDRTTGKPMRLADLRRFGEARARLAGERGPVFVEIALTLNMPQTADEALRRLLSESPTIEHIGPFDRVYAVSGDHKLLASIAARLRCQPPSRRAPGVRLVRPGLGWRRSAPEPAATGLAAAPPRCRSTRIRSSSAAVHAQAQPIGFDAGDDLVEIAGGVENSPSLLSQVGLTSTSTRGVARLAFLPAAGRPAVGPCAADDGLELHCPDVPAPGPVRSVQLASVGIGAVYLAGPEATVRTRVPPQVLTTAPLGAPPHQPWYASNGRFDDATFALGLPEGAGFGSFCYVRLGHAGRHLTAEVETGVELAPDGWWWTPDRKRPGARPRPKSKIQLDDLAERLPLVGDATLADVAARVGRRDRSLILRSIVPSGGGDVRVERRIAPGRIGAAQWMGLGVAVLALDSEVVPGPRRCAPIQDVSRVRLGARLDPDLADDWDLLCDLPLVVPC